jgi:hypothetical protein
LIGKKREHLLPVRIKLELPISYEKAQGEKH